MTTNGNNTQRNTANQVDEQKGVKDIQAATSEAVRAAKNAYESADKFLAKQAKDQPYVLLGTAAGIGFILAGGLASRLSGGLMALAGRAVAAQMVGQIGTRG